VRATVEFNIESPNATLENVYEEAQRKWQNIVKDNTAVLPSSAEMTIAYDGSSAKTTVTVRTKVGE
jgi:hypothetical protein